MAPQLLENRRFSKQNSVIHLKSNLFAHQILGWLRACCNAPSNILHSTTFDFLSTFAKVILCGDFNAHHGMWGSKRTNSNGRIMVDVIDKHDLVILNTTPTHFSLTGQYVESPRSCPCILFLCFKLRLHGCKRIFGQ